METDNHHTREMTMKYDTDREHGAFRPRALLAAALASLFLLVACEEKGPAEKAGEKIDEAVEEAQDKAEDVVDEAEDKVDEAGDAVKEAVNQN